jgi:hypothetical protein
VEDQIEKLIENIRNRSTTTAEQRRQLDLLAELSRGYQERRRNDSLEARCRPSSSPVGCRRPPSTRSKEPERKMYGDGVRWRQMMIARRVLDHTGATGRNPNRSAYDRRRRN